MEYAPRVNNSIYKGLAWVLAFDVILFVAIVAVWKAVFG